MVWAAIYRHSAALTDSLKRLFRQQTRSQRWRKDDTQTGQLTCHQALSHVLQWQWAKHTELTEQEARPSPTSVGFAMYSINICISDDFPSCEQIRL